jgi:hypothetical protein
MARTEQHHVFPTPSTAPDCLAVPDALRGVRLQSLLYLQYKHLLTSGLVPASAGTAASGDDSLSAARLRARTASVIPAVAA